MYKANRLFESIRNLAGAKKTSGPAQSAKSREVASRLSKIRAILGDAERRSTLRTEEENRVVRRLEAGLIAINKEVSLEKKDCASNKKDIGNLEKKIGMLEGIQASRREEKNKIAAIEKDVKAIKRELLYGQKSLAETKKYLGLLGAEIRAIKNAKKTVFAGKAAKRRN